MALFRGNPRSFGQWNPREPDPNRSSVTEKSAYTTREFERHLKGIFGIGIVPILDDASCLWGAIDIDNHGQSEDSDIAAIEQRVLALNLPLVPCRSKSGGVHLFLFGREPLRAAQVHSVLKKWAKDLKVEGVDCIFPKQSRLEFNNEGGRALGNWINLPYFDAEKTKRYAVINNEPQPLELFLTEAESKAVTAHQLDQLYNNEHSEAPPCIAAMITDGVDSGSRNDAAYNVTIYMKKKFPEDYRDRLYDMNGQIFKEPLPFNEMKKVVMSASRRDYRYRCSTEPCKSLCDRKTCLTRKFGITQDQSDEMDMEFEVPALTDLVKYNTNPVRWEMTCEGIRIVVSTEELFEWRVLRLKLAERLLRVPPMIKNDKWQKILKTMMATCRIEEAPEDASVDGIIKGQLIDFLRKCDLNSPGTDTAERKALYRGIPVVQVDDTDTRHVYFRGADFVQHLKRNKTEEMKGVNLWFVLKQLGVNHGRFRVEDKTPSVWSVELTDEHQLKMSVPDFTPEI
jgi:hypothetical protein